ncbi:MAG: MBL fold metallo-hydrolase [Deltaproteobacteria bacterium]|nr:MBL fold metallo-hydrolase [Deltaproteobacteria bacterium]
MKIWKKFLIGLVCALMLIFAVTGAIKINWLSLKTPTEGAPVPITVAKNKMQVILLGTGSPIVNALRSKPAAAVMAGGKLFLVDCGAGTATQLYRAGIESKDVDGIFFTHFHSDHTAGLPDFYVSSWVGGSKERNKPLHVFGPAKTRENVGKIIAGFEYDINIRLLQAHHETLGLQMNYKEMDEGVIYDDGQLKVTVFPVEHWPVKEAVGYRFDYNGKSVVLSGDTKKHPNVVKYSLNADLLVHEAFSTFLLEQAKKKYPGRAKTIDAIQRYHTSTLDVARIARDAHVKHVVLTHLMPAPSQTWYFEKLFTKGMGQYYSGIITVGRDLMEFSL